MYAANADVQQQPAAAAFLESLSERRDVVICELMLVEVYLKLRNGRVLRNPLSAPAAATHCQAFRNNACWTLVETAPVMEEVWKMAARDKFAYRRIIDARLALTLCHHGVTEFATTNERGFLDFGFTRVWNPLN